MPIIRRAEPGDLPEVSAIQSACPQAAQWSVEDYLAYELWVAICENRVAGFLSARSLAPGECEILNLAVSPLFRRRGIARELVQHLVSLSPGAIFLEVRVSNLAACQFYNSLGFQELSRRQKYYHDPPETAIVMKFHSC
jgi:ribosomal-protein-alanine N-acetyltransferase